MSESPRKFLAFSDETEECLKAMFYAAMRAKAVGAGLVILRCARSPGVGGWIGLDRDISQDAVDSARMHVSRHAEAVASRTGVKAAMVVSEDEPVDAIARLVEADPAIKMLVLAAAAGRRPGPLVSRLARGKRISARPIAVTVIPGDLTEAELDEIGGFAS